MQLTLNFMCLGVFIQINLHNLKKDRCVCGRKEELEPVRNLIYCQKPYLSFSYGLFMDGILAESDLK